MRTLTVPRRCAVFKKHVKYRDFLACAGRGSFKTLNAHEWPEVYSLLAPGAVWDVRRRRRGYSEQLLICNPYGRGGCRFDLARPSMRKDGLRAHLAVPSMFHCVS